MRVISHDGFQVEKKISPAQHHVEVALESCRGSEQVTPRCRTRAYKFMCAENNQGPKRLREEPLTFLLMP